MNRNISVFLILFVLITSLFTFPVNADSGESNHQIYLPVIFRDDYVNPWIGPWGGYVVCMVANPMDPNEIYAGTWGNGVFKSGDGGLNWTRYSRGLGDLYINSIAIDPQNPKIMYAGTYYDEVYKTTTGGELWFHSSQGVLDHEIIYTIAIDPHDPDIVYIGTRNKLDVSAAPWKGVVYRSRNEGISWTPVLTNVGGSSVQDWPYDVIVNPKDHSMVFVAFHEYGVYRSRDYGDHWEAVNQNGLTDLSGRSLLINPANTASDALYVGTWHRAGTFKSTNNGYSWEQHPLSAKVYSMDLDPQQPANLYMADFYNGVFKSTNAGNDWSYAGLAHNLMYTVMVNPLRHNQVFAGTAGNGIFRSDNYGSGWVHSQTGLYNTNVVGFAVVPGNSDQLYAGTFRGGFYHSQNGGETWQQKNQGLIDVELTDFIIHPENSDRVYALSTTRGVFTCQVSNCSWSTLNSGLPVADLDSKQVSEFLQQYKLEAEIMAEDDSLLDDQPKLSDMVALNEMVFAESNTLIVYLASAGSGLYRSQNGAGSWTLVGLNGKNVKNIAVDPANAAVVYAAVSGSASVYTSMNSGGSWVESTVPGGVVYDLATNPLEPGIVYAATNSGIYKRIDGGSWIAVGLINVPITALAIHPNNRELFVAASPGAVFYSKNSGENWIAGPDELSNATINSIHFDENDPKVAFLTTTTQSVYRLKIK